MALEIERKYLLRNDSWRAQIEHSVVMAQGYLNDDPLRTVRVRRAGDRAYLTVKGPVVGITRAEFEYEIPVADATGMLALCPDFVVEKIRHYVRRGTLLWEIDEFNGQNAGLVVAEIELPAEDAHFEQPEWVGEEVSGDPRYYNSSLASHPFRTWSS